MHSNKFTLKLYLKPEKWNINIAFTVIAGSFPRVERGIEEK
jgi:hypothetical protein